MGCIAWRPLSRRLGVALALALLLLALAPRLTPAAPSAMADASAQGAPMAFDRMFIDMMVPHHQGAIAMARIALVRAEHRQIKALAQAIIAAQTREIAQMKQWRKTWYGSAATPDMAHMPMPPDMAMMMPMSDTMHMRHTLADIAALKTARPFDKAFIADMLPHHRMAIMMAKLALIRGTHPALKAMAVAIIENQAREIGLMEAYRDIWYGGTMGHTH